LDRICAPAGLTAPGSNFNASTRLVGITSVVLTIPSRWNQISVVVPPM
jgi:hypothetical protein